MRYKITTLNITEEDPKTPDKDNVWELVSTCANGNYLYFTWHMKWTKEEKEIIQSMEL
jgi:hypothetical protein